MDEAGFVIEEDDELDEAPPPSASSASAPADSGSSPEAEEPPEAAPEDEARPEEEEEEKEEEPAELDEETLEAIVEALGDKLASHPKVREKITPELEQALRKQYEQQLIAEQTKAQREQFVQRGRQAVQDLAVTFESLSGALKKLQEGDEVELKDLPTREQIVEKVAAFGTAVYHDITAEYDSAYTAGFAEAAQMVGLTPEDVQTVQELVQTASRMQGDPNQAPHAKAYLFGETMKLIARRALETGKKQGAEEVQTKRKALEKIASANALKVALAKTASKKLPPAVPLSPAASSPGTTFADLLAQYEAARDKGDAAEADRISFEMATLRRQGLL